jgi:hypothetical protein
MKFLEHELAYRRATQNSLSRRDALMKMGGGFGSLGLASLIGSANGSTNDSSPLAPKRPHFQPKAKRIIQLFMPGGPSQVDTFDYKPMIAKHAGQRPESVNRKTLRNTKMGLMPSPFSFKQYGESGKWVSDIFPHVAECVDDICFVHSMHTDIPEHAGGILMANLGALQPNRPSMGSWLVYGLGAETQNLPGFVAMSPRAQPRGKLANWGNAFLPGAYAGSYVNINSMKPDAVIKDLKNSSLSTADQRRQADLLGELNKLQLQRVEKDQSLEASIQAMEMAFRMQFSVPEVFDISKETQATRDLYGDSEFAKGCLIARRLIEDGVRVVQLNHSIDGYDIAWDTGHGDIKGGHSRLAKACDQGIAALLKDLEGRGLLEDTLVVWGGEFGRTPMAQGKGRDHHIKAFSMWMAGGGIKPGITYGATDELGYSAEKDIVNVHDFHATMLNLLGIDHEKFTYRYQGRDFRLTDVHGKILKDILV